MEKRVKNIIIGAGPAGIQLGYFFQKADLDYVILERNEMAASFFHSYPHSGQLISINKKNTGSDVADFSLRHDWNSLLSEDGPKFTEYSDSYYPDHKDIVKYMNDFAMKYALKIQYKNAVEKIKRVENGYAILVSTPTGKVIYRCEKLTIATGIGKPDRGGIVDESTPKVKHYADYEKDYFKKPENLNKFKNKNLLIYGNGNSAYELGNLLTPYCSSVVIQGRSKKPWAMFSHYAGDVRSIYLPFHDTFFLKSLNALDMIPKDHTMCIEKGEKDEKYKIRFLCGKCSEKHDVELNSSCPFLFDNIILCTGWTFDTSIFDFPLPLTENKKYPLTKGNFESVEHKDLFFIGALMHSHDFKKSSGGFIHGFRYLIKYFFHVNYDGKLDIIHMKNNLIYNLVNHIMFKINYTSALYQMYGQMMDLFIYDSKKNTVVYVNNVHRTFIMSGKQNEDFVYFTLMLEYSSEEKNDYTKLVDRTTTVGTESQSLLLHPVLRVFKDLPQKPMKNIDVIHFDEDLFANFGLKSKYMDKLTRTLTMFIQ